MNNYTTPGNYYLALTNDISSLTNAPNFTSAFTMKVEYGNGTAYPYQIYTEYTTGRKALRYLNSTSSTWQPYVYFSNDATVLGQSRLDMMQLTNEDLDSLFAPEYLNKFFYASNNTCTNKPSGVGSFGGVTRRYGAGSYTQFLWSGYGLYIRSSSGGTKSNWNLYESQEVS